MHEIDDVVGQHGLHAQLRQRGLAGGQLVEPRDGPQLGRRGRGAGQNLALFGAGGVPDPDLEQEAIGLGLGEGIGALLL
ncbi:MAG: hypothetical protein ACK559_26815, partial [bacterium]